MTTLSNKPILYKKLSDNSKCTKCLGCNLLENPKFTGKTECGNFIDNREPFYYGSAYGNNN
jgi:hypothetical protein